MFEPEFANEWCKTWWLARKTFHAVDSAMNREFHKKKEIPHSQLDLLFVLSNQDYPMTPAEIARWLSRETQTIAGLLNRMESRGLVRRIPDPNDKRLKRVILTEKGKALNYSVQRNQVVTKMMTCFSEQECRIFDEYLLRLRESALSLSTATEEPPSIHNEKACLVE